MTKKPVLFSVLVGQGMQHNFGQFAKQQILEDLDSSGLAIALDISTRDVFALVWYCRILRYRQRSLAWLLLAYENTSNERFLLQVGKEAFAPAVISRRAYA